MLAASRDGKVNVNHKPSNWFVGRYVNSNGHKRWYTYRYEIPIDLTKPGYATREDCMWDLVNRNVIND